MSNNLRKGVTSSALLVVDSMAKKLVGLVSTLILARVLLPEDFGIIAIASLMVGFIEVLSKTGSTHYLLRVDNLDDDKVNTAWTINLIIRSSMSLVIILSSYFIASLYGDPRLTFVLISLTLVFFAYSFVNPGLAFLRRQQNYTKIVKLTITTKIISVSAAVTSALLLQNYWALVIGQSTSAFLMIIGSHFIYNHKLKFKMSNAKDQWQFSGWIIPQSIFGYCRTQLDTFIVSSSFGQSALGSYHTMKYIAFLPSSQIIMPIGEPFLVELAKSKNSRTYFSKQLKTSLILLMLIGLPISSIMYYHHLAITTFLLGSNWTEYSYLMSAFGLLIPSVILRQQSSKVLMVFGKTKLLFIIECFAFSIVYGVLLMHGMDEIKTFSFLLATMESGVSLAMFVFVLFKYTGLKSSVNFAASILPLPAGLIAGGLVSSSIANFELNVLLQLILITTSFFVFFLLTISIFYLVGYKKFSEWAYLVDLLTRVAKPVLKKIFPKAKIID